jgi:hypothetical protein
LKDDVSTSDYTALNGMMMMMMMMMMIIIIIIIHLTASGLSPGGSGYYAYT